MTAVSSGEVSPSAFTRSLAFLNFAEELNKVIVNSSPPKPLRAEVQDLKHAMAALKYGHTPEGSVTVVGGLGRWEQDERAEDGVSTQKVVRWLNSLEYRCNSVSCRSVP